METEITQRQTDMSAKTTEKTTAEFASKEENLHYDNVFDISPTELNQNRGQVVIIDVREVDEFAGELGHIPGSLLIPLNTLSANSNKIPKDKTVVFVCRSGGRSGRATAWALQAGWTQVFNMKGGMLLWNDLHLPTEM